MVPRKTALNDFIAPANVIVVYKNSATFDGLAIRDYFLKRLIFLAGFGLLSLSLIVIGLIGS